MSYPVDMSQGVGAGAESSGNGAPRRNRFKNSCDSCAQAKVKCGHERPSCKRCLRNGLSCHYSLARRGKAGVALAAMSQQPRMPDTLTADSVPATEHRAVTDSTNNYTEGFGSSAELALFYRDFTLAADIRSTSPAGETVTTTTVSCEHHDAGCHDFQSLSFSTLSGLEAYQLTPPVEPNDLALAPAHCSPDLGEQLDSTTGMRLVLSVLESLYTESPAVTPGIDSILRTNSTAIATMSTLLKSPCQPDTPHTTLRALLALVCCNSVIDAYQQILRVQEKLPDADGERKPSAGCDREGGHQDTQHHQHHHNHHHLQLCQWGSGTATAVDMPVAVGAFILDDNAKHKVISSLLLNELTRLGNVMSKVLPGDQGCNIAAGRGSSGRVDPVFTLQSLLREKLRATVRAVKDEMVNDDDA